MGSGYRLDDVRGMTLIQMVGFVRMSSAREMVAIKMQSVAVRMAFGADEDQYKTFLKTLGGD